MALIIPFQGQILILYHLRFPILALPNALLEVASTMSTFPENPTSSSSSNFQEIFNAAVKAYEKRTKKDLLLHPLASQLQACKSPASILAVLQGQVDDLDQAQERDERLTKWLSPTVNVLLTFSATVGGGISLVRIQVFSF